jgi:hypothetical protein
MTKFGVKSRVIIPPLTLSLVHKTKKFALASLYAVLANAAAPALFALASLRAVRANAAAPALFALVSYPAVRANAAAPALFALVSYPAVRANAAAPAVFASASLSAVRAETLTAFCKIWSAPLLLPGLLLAPRLSNGGDCTTSESEAAAAARWRRPSRCSAKL